MYDAERVDAEILRGCGIAPPRRLFVVMRNGEWDVVEDTTLTLEFKLVRGGYLMPTVPRIMLINIAGE